MQRLSYTSPCQTLNRVLSPPSNCNVSCNPETERQEPSLKTVHQYQEYLLEVFPHQVLPPCPRPSDLALPSSPLSPALELSA